MAKFINDSAMDAELAWIRDNTTMISACNAQPTTSTQAGTTYALGTMLYGTASWTLAPGDTSGRKITAGAASIPVASSGTASHVAFFNAGTLVGVGTIAPTAVTAGGTIVVSAFDFDEIRDPA
jgi:hypothetical protein